MSNKQKTQMTNLVCLECGSIMMIHRKMSNLKKVGHIKHLYCIDCDKRTPHYEVKEINNFLWEYDGVSDDMIDDNTLKVLGYLKERKDGNARKGFGVYKKILTRN